MQAGRGEKVQNLHYYLIVNPYEIERREFEHHLHNSRHLIKG